MKVLPSLVFTSLTEIFSKIFLLKMLRLVPEHHQQSVCMKSRHFVQSQYAAAVVQDASFFSNDLTDRLAMQILSSAFLCVHTLSSTVTSSF